MHSSWDAVLDDQFGLSLLECDEPGQIMTMGPDGKESWVITEATLDSGSAVSVLPRGCIFDPPDIKECFGGPQSYNSAFEHSCKLEGYIKPECWFQSGMQGTIAFKVLQPLKKESNHLSLWGR